MVCAKGDWNLWQASVILMTLDCAKIVWQLALLCFIRIAIPLCYISLDLTAEIPAQMKFSDTAAATWVVEVVIHGLIHPSRWCCGHCRGPHPTLRYICMKLRHLKVWHFWISTGQKIGKSSKFQCDETLWNESAAGCKVLKTIPHSILLNMIFLAMTFHKTVAEFYSRSVASRSFAREQHTLALTATYWLHLMTQVVSISNDSLSQNFGLCVALQSSGHDVPNPK